MYKLGKNIMDGDRVVVQADYVQRLFDNAFIPFDPANTDYAEYLKWLEAGNTPLPPDTQPE